MSPAGRRAIRVAVAVRATIVAVLLVLAWMFLLSPRLSAPDGYATEADELQARASTLRAAAAAPDEAERRYAAATTVADTLTTWYPADVLPASLTDAVRAAATNAGVPLDTLTEAVPSDPVLGGTDVSAGGEGATSSTGETSNVTYATATLTVTITGTWEQVWAFTEALPTQDRRLFLTALTVTGADTPGQVTGTVTVTTLLLKPVPTPTSPTSPNQPEADING